MTLTLLNKTLSRTGGHSTPHRALEFCQKANVKRLILFHHAPEDIDQDVTNKVSSVESPRKNHPHIVDVVAAKEGDVWDLK